jgi:hypothetical protein
MKSNQRKHKTYVQMRKGVEQYTLLSKRRPCFHCSDDRQELVYMSGFGKHSIVVDFRLRSNPQIIQLQTSVYTPFCKCGNFLISEKRRMEIMYLARKRFNVKRLSELKMQTLTLMTPGVEIVRLSQTT